MKKLTKIADNFYIDKNLIFSLEQMDDLTIDIATEHKIFTVIFSSQEASDEAFDRLTSPEV
jgi:hypothetical protein